MFGRAVGLKAPVERWRQPRESDEFVTGRSQSAFCSKPSAMLRPLRQGYSTDDSSASAVLPPILPFATYGACRVLSTTPDSQVWVHPLAHGRPDDPLQVPPVACRRHTLVRPDRGT